MEVSLELTENAFDWHKAIKAALFHTGTRQSPQVKNSTDFVANIIIILIVPFSSLSLTASHVNSVWFCDAASEARICSGGIF